MSPPPASNEQRGPEGPRSHRLASTLAGAPTVTRTTWDGHASLSIGHDRYVRRRGALRPDELETVRAELDEHLTSLLSHPNPDPELVALALVDHYGPAYARCLARELGHAAEDVLAAGRRPWGSAGR